MIQARLRYILFFSLGTSLLFGGNMALSFGQSNLKFEDMNLKSNSLNLSIKPLRENFWQQRTFRPHLLKLQKNPSLKNRS